MKNKKTPEQLVEACEELLRPHGVGAIIIVTDENGGQFSLHIPEHALFKAKGKDQLVLKAFGATEDKIEAEFTRLRMMASIAHDMIKTLKTMAQVLHKHTTKATSASWDGNSVPATTARKNYDNN